MSYHSKLNVWGTSWLTGQPEMQVAGNGSSAYRLNWYQDRVGNAPLQVTIYSLPMVVYKLLMLA